jgi:plastocyanin
MRPVGATATSRRERGSSVIKSKAKWVALAVLAGGALLAGGYALAGSGVVTLTSTGPQPPSLTVAWGDTVVMTNANSAAYKLALRIGTVETATIPPGGTYTRVFNDRAGRYRYNVVAGKSKFSGDINVTLNGTVSIAAKPVLVNYGESVRLTGRSTLVGIPVTVQQRSQGAAKTSGGGREAWTDVAVLNPGADGSFALTVRPLAGMYYRASTAQSQLSSAQVTVNVEPRLGFRVSPLTTRTDGVINVSAKVTPPNAATEVYLERKAPRRTRFTVVTHARVQPDGSAALVYKNPEAGEADLRLELKPPTLLDVFAGIVSPLFKVTVNWPPTKLAFKTLAAPPPKKVTTKRKKGAKTTTQAPRPTKFSVKRLTAHPSVVTLAMTNLDSRPHNVAIRGLGVLVKGRIVGKGGTSRVTAKLKAGTYRFYSSVGNDAKTGLSGTLLVR